MTKCWLFPQCNRLRHTNIQGRCKCLYVRSTYQSATSTLLLRHFVSSFQGVQFLFFPFFPYYCFASEAKICNKIENGVIVVCVFVRFIIKQVVCWLWCSSILCFHLTSQPFPNMGIRHICPSVCEIYDNCMPSLSTPSNFKEFCASIIDVAEEKGEEDLRWGFQRPTLGPVRNFNVVSGEFVQILHTGSDHWVCVSSIGCLPGYVNLYDSLYHDAICQEVEDQTNDLLGGRLVSLQFVSVQQQTNGCDCGIFAIAFATCLALGTNPSNVTFDIQRMRSHLVTCLRATKMSMFPCFWL